MNEGPPSPSRWLQRAPVTRALLVLNVLVFVVELVSAGARSFGAPFPMRLLLELGASYPPATIGEDRWETLLTACFLHGGVIHVSLNMFALWQAGPLVERSVGSARMGPLYLAAGVSGNLLSVLYGWSARIAVPSVGASGAICGVIGAALVVGWRTQGWRGPVTQAMVRWLAFLLVFGLLSNWSGALIDNAAHVGGALAGAAIASTWRRGARFSAAAEYATLSVCGALLLGSVGVLAWRDRTNAFAAMTLQDRADYTKQALRVGRCEDADEGLAAVERLRGRAAPVTSLRQDVEATCGRIE